MKNLDRRSVLKLFGGMGAAGAIPPVKDVEVLQITPKDTVVLSFKSRLSFNHTQHIHKEWESRFPGVTLLVLEEGAEIKVLRSIGGKA